MDDILKRLDKLYGELIASTIYGHHAHTVAEARIEIERALRPEVEVRKMPDPPPSMNYLEAEAWKLGWYNAVYGRDPWDTRSAPQSSESK